jgi:hypothetical protein
MGKFKKSFRTLHISGMHILTRATKAGHGFQLGRRNFDKPKIRFYFVQNLALSLQILLRNILKTFMIKNLILENF